MLVFTDTLEEQGKAARDGADWHVCLEALDARLDGIGAPAAGRGQQVHAGFAEEFGPGAATLGPPARPAAVANLLRMSALHGKLPVADGKGIEP